MMDDGRGAVEAWGRKFSEIHLPTEIWEGGGVSRLVTYRRGVVIGKAGLVRARPATFNERGVGVGDGVIFFYL